jgi:hypothetical protein
MPFSVASCRLIAVTLLLPAIFAQGQTPPPPGVGRPSPSEARLPRSPLIETLDLNSDGTVDAAELAKASDSLRKLDSNGDGRLTEKKFRPFRRDDTPRAPKSRGNPIRRPEPRPTTTL